LLFSLINELALDALEVLEQLSVRVDNDKRVDVVPSRAELRRPLLADA
jgi:hypothetical protein